MKLILLQIYWALTRSYLRLRGAKVGTNVRCNGFPYVRVRKGGRLVIADDVMINASRWANAHVIQGSTTFYVDAGAELVLGRAAGVSGCRLVAMERIEIGSRSMVGGGCLICDSDMHEIPLGSSSGIRKKPISIGSRVFLGAHSIVLKGVTIGDGAVIGAGAVVSRDVGPEYIVAGNPATLLRAKAMEEGGAGTVP